MAEKSKVKPIPCTVRPQIHVPVGDKTEFHSGCSIVDILFPNVFFVEIGEIHFKNYYTAYLSVQAKMKEQSSNTGSNESKWKTCVKNLQLMPSPHSDQASENYFTITSKQMKFALSNITKLRFILRQPSPVWKEYRIEEVTLYKYSYNQPVEQTLPAWIKEENETGFTKREIKGLGSMDDMSSKLQQLWAMVEQCKATQNDNAVARYDVDGSYEINLLSYT